MDYKTKYYKYKSKYLNLLDQCGGKLSSKLTNKPNNKPYNYFFVHLTKNFDSLKDILKSGYLYSGKQLSLEKRFQSGDDAVNYVFTNIYFDDLKNLTHLMDFTIILSPDVFTEHKKEIKFNKGWGFENIPLKDQDMNAYLKIIRKYLKTLEGLPKTIKDFSPHLHHEVLFEDKINLHKNLLGIVCNGCSDSRVNNLKKILKSKKYKNIKIYTNNLVPSYKELIK
jgi:hypothetical protein